MKGILRLAFKLLVNDSAKFTAFLVGITFAVFLMIEMTSMFAGILDKASATVTNIGAKIGCALRLARADRTQFARPAPSVISRVWGGFGRGRRAAASIAQVGPADWREHVPTGEFHHFDERFERCARHDLQRWPAHVALGA